MPEVCDAPVSVSDPRSGEKSKARFWISAGSLVAKTSVVMCNPGQRGLVTTTPLRLVIATPSRWRVVNLASVAAGPWVPRVGVSGEHQRAGIACLVSAGKRLPGVVRGGRWGLPSDALIELVLGCRLGMGVEVPRPARSSASMRSEPSTEKPLPCAHCAIAWA